MSDIISTNDLLLKEENKSNDKNIINAVKKALKQLTVMSEIEGKNIYLDLVERIELLNELISETEIIFPTLRSFTLTVSPISNAC